MDGDTTSSSDQSSAETSRLDRMSAYAEANPQGGYFGGGDSAAGGGAAVADTTVAPDQSTAETSRLAAMNASLGAGASTGGGYFGSFGGLASESTGSTLGQQLKKLWKDFVSPTMQARAVVVNPPAGIINFVLSRIEDLGTPSPYGPSDPTPRSSSAFASILPAPNSFAAQQQVSSAPGVLTSSYIATRSNVQAPTQSASAQVGAVVALAVLAKLALAS